ncbi:MAG: addiction module protein [Gemmatimonadetes bacterium]|nr:addiction module protein [Gemmatimonadota bacterium]
MLVSRIRYRRRKWKLYLSAPEDHLSDPVDRIETEARRLSVADRARLAHRLLESLDDDTAEDPEEVDRAWQAEIERRIAAYRAGEVEAMPAAEVLREARGRLRRR